MRPEAEYDALDQKPDRRKEDQLVKLTQLDLIKEKDREPEPATRL